MNELFIHNGKKFSDKDLLECLYNLGIKRGDYICIHSSIFEFGRALIDYDKLLSNICKVFFDIVGKEGIVMMPTFTYSFCDGDIYDKEKSKSKVGILGEFFRKLKGVYRTDDPIFSFAVYGDKSYEFLKTTDSCFGKNSPYDILVKNNGKIVMFGLKEEGYSFNMYIEQYLKVRYRYFKTFTGIMIDNDGNCKDKSINYYVRDLTIDPKPDRRKRVKVLEENDILKSSKFAGSNICVIDARKNLNLFVDILKKDENYFNL
ncbi:aminoglycoside N3'-acetyltransferase [Campylobacter pinnipediorum subsp. pinnipediorum]|uniref:AAC(3) family N-acetyltransferase n=1 Tax=Campylobacter pinnipediorum TaxID=1965231 RepID=UPI000995242C|nr:AAC(3) family N-acetyltransferase [Campylobacter pinnipediorum]AQW81324.1 aminoglycoside N3'-acetyltransferase [Campylobacter pinnipediorum subsp. pinnipediorum]